MRGRRKRFIYRRSAPVIGLCLTVIICSGVILTIMEKTGGISFGMDGMNYIVGAIAADAYLEDETEISESKEINGNESSASGEESGSEDQTQQNSAVEETESTEITNDGESKGKGILKMLLCTALSYDESDSDVIAENSDTNNVVVSSEISDELKVISSVVGATDNSDENQASDASTPVVSDITGAVFIYHTHSTESYEPYSAGNYHITGSEGTVRNVANNLTSVLESKGIKVYHDTTLHDNPSYTNSYGRSLNTAQNYLSQYTDITVMIDLHRDAMASGGKKYSTIEVNGQRATSFNIVVGKQNNNYSELMNFANLVINKANELYPGLGGRIIEREYKFNEFLSNHYMLAEVGNNGNTIEEAEMTGRLLGDVIEAVMREI